jgi:hypothetical protein
VRANVDSIRFLQEHPGRSMRIAEQQLVRDGAPPMSAEVIDRAWQQLTFAWDPVADTMVRVTEDAYALGVLPVRPEGILGIYRLDALRAVLDDEGLPPVEMR